VVPAQRARLGGSEWVVCVVVPVFAVVPGAALVKGVRRCVVGRRLVGPVAGSALQVALVVLQLVRLDDLAACDFCDIVRASADPCTISRNVGCIPASLAVFRTMCHVKLLAVVRRAPLVPGRVCAVDQVAARAPVGPVASRARQQAGVIL
jgi:hypothetical protein